MMLRWDPQEDWHGSPKRVRYQKEECQPRITVITPYKALGCQNWGEVPFE